jgi:hypothetical protein
MLLACIRKVLGSNLGHNTDYSGGGVHIFPNPYSIRPASTGILALLSGVFRSFLQSLQANTRTVPQLDHDSNR